MIKKQLDYIKKVNSFRKYIFDKIAEKEKNQVWLKASLRVVRRVAIINSAPRSGSSLLFAILKKIPGIYSLSGESVPFYKLNGLSSDSFQSDEIPEELLNTIDGNTDFNRDLISDFSIVYDEDSMDDDLLEHYTDDLVLRFAIQWPQIDFNYERFRKIAKHTFHNNSAQRRFSKEEFYLELVKNLRDEYPVINPYYYDIPPYMIKERFPDEPIPSAPPNSTLMIEEPPFILLSPHIKVNRNDLSEKILLLKTPINCYRMDYIKKVFSNADISIIYLTRNPAASINGLYEGWLYRGYFSHNLETFYEENRLKFKELKITGYSDKHEWGKKWWNYDLPPGWQDYTRKKLEEVCAFQWCSANKAITEYLNNNNINCCRIRYENIVANLISRFNEIERIIEFLGLQQSTIESLKIDKLPIVQATELPQQYRWKKRKNIILPLFSSYKLSMMLSQLGYDKNSIEEWV